MPSALKTEQHEGLDGRVEGVGIVQIIPIIALNHLCFPLINLCVNNPTKPIYFLSSKVQKKREKISFSLWMCVFADVETNGPEPR